MKDAIEVRRHCTARHIASEPVIELFKGDVASDGVVETFRLVGHPKAKRRHAWSCEENGETQSVTVMGEPAAASPLAAVRVWLVSPAKK